MEDIRFGFLTIHGLGGAQGPSGAQAKQRAATMAAYIRFLNYDIIDNIFAFTWFKLDRTSERFESVEK